MRTNKSYHMAIRIRTTTSNSGLPAGTSRLFRTPGAHIGLMNGMWDRLNARLNRRLGGRVYNSIPMG